MERVEETAECPRDNAGQEIKVGCIVVYNYSGELAVGRVVRISPSQAMGRKWLFVVRRVLPKTHGESEGFKYIWSAKHRVNRKIRLTEYDFLSYVRSPRNLMVIDGRVQIPTEGESTEEEAVRADPGPLGSANGANT